MCVCVCVSLRYVQHVFPHIVIIPYETVVKELQADLVEYSAGVGMKGMRFFPSQYPEGLVVTIKVCTIQPHQSRLVQQNNSLQFYNTWGLSLTVHVVLACYTYSIRLYMLY